MSKKISILLTDEQYAELAEKAKDSNLTITDYVVSQLPISQEKKVQLADVLEKVKKLPIGEFNIPALFTEQEWNGFTKGSRLTVGKQFFKEVNNLPNVNFKGKNSANLAIYEKIK